MGARQSRLNDENSVVVCQYFNLTFIQDQQIMDRVSANNSDILINQRQNDRRNSSRSGMRQSIAFNVDINIDKRTIGLIRNHQQPDSYYLDFIFDAAQPCKIKIFICTNQIRNSNGQLLYFYVPEDLPPPSCYKFSKQLNQKFPRRAAKIDFSKYNKEQLTVHNETFYPLVILMQIDREQQLQSMDNIEMQPRPLATLKQNSYKKKQKSVSQITYAQFKKQKNQYQIRVLKQKIIFNNHIFDIYDIFDGESGIATESQRKQCVICFSRIQDTIVLPCRHLCLCQKCTQIVRVQTNKCPICRSNVTSFLQFKLQGVENNQQQALIQDLQTKA